eukprot:Nk52_evm49s212 gene=Nk52_evmTU49s212
MSRHKLKSIGCPAGIGLERGVCFVSETDYTSWSGCGDGKREKEAPSSFFVEISRRGVGSSSSSSFSSSSSGGGGGGLIYICNCFKSKRIPSGCIVFSKAFAVRRCESDVFVGDAEKEEEEVVIVAPHPKSALSMARSVGVSIAEGKGGRGGVGGKVQDEGKLKLAIVCALRQLVVKRGLSFYVSVVGESIKYKINIEGVDQEESEREGTLLNRGGESNWATDAGWALFSRKTRVEFVDDDDGLRGDKTGKGMDFNEQRERDSKNMVAGLNDTLGKLREVIVFPFLYPHVFEKMGIECPKGVLLYGPPGCGKTAMVRAIAKECDASLRVINGPEILGSYLGDAEQKLREAFQTSGYEEGKPAMLFIDEIDALCPKRTDGKAHESRVVAQMLTLMDGMNNGVKGKDMHHRLVVIGATNRPGAIDPALRRPGRFDREVNVKTPSYEQRRDIFDLYCRSMPIHRDVDLDKLARNSVGYVGADIEGVCGEAALMALREEVLDSKLPDGEPHRSACVRQVHFERAMGKTVPSTHRGHHVDVARVTWNDIGGLERVKIELQKAVEWPLRYSEAFSRLKVSPPKGIVLYGPPGCSKTTLVKAVANSCKASFFAVSGAQVYSSFVGDAEKTIRDLFTAARNCLPAIIFFDEIDALVGKRSSGMTDPVRDRILSTLLNEMDGIEASNNILVLGATNRLDMIDEALLRPGRFDSKIFIPLPDEEARLAILKIYTKNLILDSSVDLKELVDLTSGRSGAEIENICREALSVAINENFEECVVTQEHFLMAIIGA